MRRKVVRGARDYKRRRRKRSKRKPKPSPQLCRDCVFALGGWGEPSACAMNRPQTARSRWSWRRDDTYAVRFADGPKCPDYKTEGHRVRRYNSKLSRYLGRWR